MLRRLPSLRLFALAETPGIAQHLSKLAAGSRLRTLIITECQLEHLPQSLGVWAAKLMHLDLSRNKLSYFPLMIRDMLQLQVLDLSYNKHLHLSLPDPSGQIQLAWHDIGRCAM